GLYHPPGGIIRHDAVVWGYARGVDRLGIHIHPRTEVTAIERDNGKITGVQTSRGKIATRTVVNATAGWCSIIGHMAGVELPIVSRVDGIEGFILDVGWGTYGFKAAPAAGFRVAEMIDTGKTPDVIKPFTLSRFANLQPLGEKAAAAVSH